MTTKIDDCLVQATDYWATVIYVKVTCTVIVLTIKFKLIGLMDFYLFFIILLNCKKTK